MDPARIRNFSIIAHIDHGKSTLADRLLEATGAISAREMTDQVLDSMDLERERGITIKLRAVRMDYRTLAGEDYVLNLIDTPGHVDFSYEVSRSLAASDGALLVVDATQGIEAQTIANLYLALEHDLKIIPVVNKIDLPAAEPERVLNELREVVGIDPATAIMASAKTGLGTQEILEAIVARLPAPSGLREASPRALVFDSHYDPYRGVIAYVRVVDGELRPGSRLRFLASGRDFEPVEIGYFAPEMTAAPAMGVGEVGYLIAGIKDVREARVGDTITSAHNPARQPLPGYRRMQPMVFAGLYPSVSEDYERLRDSLGKLQLNDAALQYEPETSGALGFGFRCGFLGLLHMEIVQERLEREYGLDLIFTAPGVSYEVHTTAGEKVTISNPADLPDVGRIERIEEPVVRATIIAPTEHIGAIMELCQEKRGRFNDMSYLSPTRALMTYDLPLAEILVDFFDKLKSRTRGYASLDYEYLRHEASDLVKLDILLNGKPVDALSAILHRDRAYYHGRALVSRLRELIPRQLFEIPVQAAVGSRVIARESVKALRKDVLAKCYGGDITRKRKLLEKQKEGKKRMKQIGTVEVPQEAFLAVLKLEE